MLAGVEAIPSDGVKLMRKLIDLWWLACVLACVAGMAGEVFGQISVPEQSDPHSKLIATLEHDAPEGSQVKYSWDVSDGVDYERVGDRLFLWAPPGEHDLSASLIWVKFEIITIEVDGEPKEIRNLIDFGQQQHRASFSVGEPEPPEPPDPPDPPAPDVPDDQFQNIGKRVALWATGFDEAGEVAEAYRDAASSLRTDPQSTVDSVSADLISSLKDDVDFDAYASEIGTNINADLQERWPMSKGVLADYYDAVAVGLEAAS